jgi:hypothetical protein
MWSVLRRLVRAQCYKEFKANPVEFETLGVVGGLRAAWAKKV